MLANGCKCTIGDQMDYWGRLNQDMYRQIGDIYENVEQKEPWCIGAVPVSEIGVFTAEEFFATGVAGDIPGATEGVTRMLLELSIQFDLIDSTADFNRYKLLILPDVIPVDQGFGAKLSAYIQSGGKVIASYHSGMDSVSRQFTVPELAVEYLDEAPYSPDFIRPQGYLAESLADAEHAMYDRGTLVKVNREAQVQPAIKPVFNRSYEHFCSHLHSPSSREEAYPAVVATAQTAYFIHPIFTTYQNTAPRWYRILMENEIRRLLGDALVSHDGPISVITNLLEQPAQKRVVLHVLHYIPHRKCKKLDIIDDVIPLYNLKVEMYQERRVKKVYTVPDRQEIMFEQQGSRLCYQIPEILGHHMSAIEFE